MKFDTAYNHHKRLASRMDSIYRTGIASQSLHADILANLKREVYEDPAYKKAPRWVRDQLSARSEMALKEIFRYWLVWMFETPSGLKTWEAMTEEERQTYLGGKTGNHYWLKLSNPVSYQHFELLPDQKARATYTITNKPFSL